MNQTIQLSERHILEDSINAQKYIATCYNRNATECINKQLQTALIHIASEELELFMELQDELLSHGWLQTKDADQSEISNVKDMYIDNTDTKTKRSR